MVIVDDGSEDSTYLIAKRYEEKGIVKVVRKDPSGCKASPINRGLLFAKGEILSCLDADTLVSKDSLEWVARYFEDEKSFQQRGLLEF